MVEKFTPDLPEEEDNDGKLSLQQQFLSTLELINTASNRLMRCDVSNKMKAVVSSTENKVYGVQQKVKRQQLNLIDLWKK
jgi:hypothetical protein